MRSPLAELLSDLNAVFEQISSRWYLFGAQAAIIHGAARLTADVDATVLLGDADIARLLAILEANHFHSRLDDPAGFIERTRVLPLVHTSSNMPVDLVFGGSGLEEEFLRRAVQFDIEGVKVLVASAEDLVVMKLLSGRPKDMDDVSAILTTQAATFDYSYCREMVERLERALDRRDLLVVLDDLVRRV